MEDDLIHTAWQQARSQRLPAAIVTVVATRGSVPRAVGARMVVPLHGAPVGTIGGGKLEALAVEAAVATIGSRQPILKTWTLREAEPDSFGAICGGEVTLFIEPIARREALFLAGAGHCARALARLARECDLHVTVIEDRAEELALCDAAHQRVQRPAADFIREHLWQPDEALVLVSRNFQEDQAALQACLRVGLPDYLGMIGSKRKVLHVFDELKKHGATGEQLARVHAPIGFDIGADSPAEIAVSILAEILAVLRQKSGRSFR